MAMGAPESTGFFSQQLILAEGGFKSARQPIRQWITTLNEATTYELADMEI
jgi:hypothetical protein